MGKRRTSGDGGLYRRADGMWIGVVELESKDGKRRRRTVSSKDRNQAIAKLKKLRADVDAGRIAVTSHTTVEKWLDKWLEEIHRPRVRPTTYRDYRTTINSHIKPHIGARRLDKLTPEHVRQMARAIRSDRSAEKAHIVLKRALEDAVKEGMLLRNVATVVDKPKYTAPEREPLTAEQAKQLLRSCRDREDPMFSRWAAALLLGERQGELLGLQWSEIDYDTREVVVSWQLQQMQKVHGCGNRHSDGTYPCGRKRPGWCPNAKWDLPRGFEHKILHRSLGLTRPKSKAGKRRVPIPPTLWEVIAAHPFGKHNPHNLVWHHPDGRPISPRDDSRNWHMALKLADLPPAPLHIARHTTNTLLLESGVPEDMRMAILGHSSVAAHRVYGHTSPEARHHAMSPLSVLLD